MLAVAWPDGLGKDVCRLTSAGAKGVPWRARLVALTQPTHLPASWLLRVLAGAGPQAF